MNIPPPPARYVVWGSLLLILLVLWLTREELVAWIRHNLM